MRCKKKANYIFQGFMTVLSRSAGCFVFIKKNESYRTSFLILSSISLFIFFLLRHQKETKMLRFSTCIMVVERSRNAISTPLNERFDQKDFSLPLLSICLMAIPYSHGKTYKAAQTLA
jgi:hypothetical protein